MRYALLMKALRLNLVKVVFFIFFTYLFYFLLFIFIDRGAQVPTQGVVAQKIDRSVVVQIESINLSLLDDSKYVFAFIKITSIIIIMNNNNIVDTRLMLFLFAN